MEKFKLSKSSKNVLKGLDKNILTLINKTLEKSDIEFSIPKLGGLRTPQQQNNVYHSKPKKTNLDGFKTISEYQLGKAFSIELKENNIENYIYLKNIFLEVFNSMKDDGDFEKDVFLKWGGDYPRLKNIEKFYIA